MNAFMHIICVRITTVGLILFLQFFTKGNTCEDVQCSNVVDYVCGALITYNGDQFIMKYQNICKLNKISCKLRYIIDIHQVPDRLCNIKRAYSNGRRVNDFSIIGARQACNHTCPTYCTDIYEPACAVIKFRNKKTILKPMINHCHIDLLSCAVGVNVTIQPLTKCYKEPPKMMFYNQIVAMRSLKLL